MFIGRRLEYGYCAYLWSASNTSWNHVSASLGRLKVIVRNSALAAIAALMVVAPAVNASAATLNEVVGRLNPEEAHVLIGALYLKGDPGLDAYVAEIAPKDADQAAKDAKAEIAAKPEMAAIAMKGYAKLQQEHPADAAALDAKAAQARADAPSVKKKVLKGLLAAALLGAAVAVAKNGGGGGYYGNAPVAPVAPPMQFAQAQPNVVPHRYRPPGIGPGGADSIGPGGGLSIAPGGGLSLQEQWQAQSIGPGGGMSIGPGGGQSIGPGGGLSIAPGGGASMNPAPGAWVH
jgi:hypothetical protein